MDEIYLANRSGAYCASHEYEKAAQDARRCLALQPGWAKGHVRLAQAHLGLEEWAAAQQAFSTALQIDPDLEAGRCGLEVAKAKAEEEKEQGVRFQATKKEREGAGLKEGRGDAETKLVPGANSTDPKPLGKDKAVKNKTLLSFGDDEDDDDSVS